MSEHVELMAAVNLLVAGSALALCMHLWRSVRAFHLDRVAARVHPRRSHVRYR